METTLHRQLKRLYAGDGATEVAIGSFRVDAVRGDELVAAIDRPRWFAQKVAYVLRNTGAIRSEGRNRSGVIYQAAQPPRANRVA